MSVWTGWSTQLVSELNLVAGGNGTDLLIGTDRAMRSVGSYATHLFRLPTGDPDNKALPILEAQQLGYLHVDFDYDTLDWQATPGTTGVPWNVDALGGPAWASALPPARTSRAAPVGAA